MYFRKYVNLIEWLSIIKDIGVVKNKFFYYYITIHIQFFTKCVNTNENKFSVKLILSFPETSLLQIMLSLFCANKRNSTEIILSFKTSPKHFRRKCLLLRFSVYYTNLKVVMDNLHFMRNRCAINIDLSRFAFKFLKKLQVCFCCKARVYFSPP